MKFGVFDHVDDSGVPLEQHLEARLQMAEAYDRLGFHCYHVAEHHGTPLGHAPSPGILFAALSQRTARLNFGPLVYLLPLYHPLRLLEEIGMLDALSGGRYQFGFGRGISPIEAGFFGVDPEEQPAIYAEALEVLMQGLSSDRLDHRGSYFSFDDVPLRQRPVQRPHPPLWYGTSSPGSVERCAKHGWNLVTLASGERMREMVQVYKDSWEGSEQDMPLVGVGRHIVLADSDEAALALARPAFARWSESFAYLWDERGVHNPIAAMMPRDWDSLEASGMGCAGSPGKVRAFLQQDRAFGGYTYLVAQLAFGGLTAQQVIRSAELLAHDVMPSLARMP